MSSALARAEVARALLLEGEVGIERGKAVLDRIDMVRVNNRVLTAAGSLLPVELRSLDAIHLATAQELGRDLGQVITYDERMVDAARQLGIKTASPA